jgi:DNA-binding HxlR family transcriptional regulator
MTRRTYGQYCGLVYALDLVGERWALLIVRDLLLEPKRFSDFSAGLPGIPSNVLSARLKELEENGIVRRRVLPRPSGAVVYELTEYGRGLEDVLIGLGRWGSRSLGTPREGEILTEGALAVALHVSFQPEAARGLDASFEVRVGELVVHAKVDGEQLWLTEGGGDAADLVLETGPALVSVLRGEITPEEAIAAGGLKATGDRVLLARFFEVFRLPPAAAAAV